MSEFIYRAIRPIAKTSKHRAYKPGEIIVDVDAKTLKGYVRQGLAALKVQADEGSRANAKAEVSDDANGS